jgi:hypothetical protein
VLRRVPTVFAKLFSWLRLDIPKELVEQTEISRLAVDWCSPEAGAAPRAFGDAWLNIHAIRRALGGDAG